MNRINRITVTRSAGLDGAVVVFLDGDFPGGLRIVVNDSEEHGVPYEPQIDAEEREAGDVTFTYELADIAYTDEDPDPIVKVTQEGGYAGPWTARCICGWSQPYSSASKAQHAAQTHGDETGHDASNA